MGWDCLAAGVLVADHLCTPIPRMPEPGELLVCDALPLRIGGCAANASVDLVRAGVRVGVVGCVGRDPFGRFVRESLAEAGVDTVGISELPDTETSGTLILNVQGQDRRFVHNFGANARFTMDQLPWSLVSQARVLYLGGYHLLPALNPEGLARLFRRARAAGIRTVLDVVLPGPGTYWPALAPVLPETDVFLPNTDEARVITGLTDPVAQARRFRDAGVGTAVITCGAEGTVLVSDDLAVRAGTFPVELFVGATGAGDAFDAGYIVGLLQDNDPLDCLRWGSALGASCVRSVGATDSVFTRAEAEAFLAEHVLPLEFL